MYRNWFRYGDVEVANNVRVQHYVENGLKPVGTFIGACDDCGDLPTVADGVDEYRTPELDMAPWVLGNDSDAGDFAGVMVKEVTGLEGSTTEVEVVEKVGDGGAIGTRRASSRTVAVTADVVGRTREAATLGLEWLSAALHPPCSPGGDCGGGVLHMFTTCPVACVGQTDPEALPETTTYGDAASFQTSAIITTNPFVKNQFTNPSGNTATNWGSNAAFGAYVTGTVSAVAAVGGWNLRPNVVRLSTPALALGQRTNVVLSQPVDETGTYEFSVWVYVPTATTLEVRAVNVFASGGPFVNTKDKWIRLTHRQTITAGDSPFLGIDTKDADAAKAAGMFIYVAGASLRRVGTFTSSGNNQGSLTTSIDGWHGNNAFGSFTVPQAITCESFASPNMFNPAVTNPKSIRVEWKSALDPGTVAHAVYNSIDGTIPGQVYTVECDIYMPAGTPDVETDVLYNGKGGMYTTKGSWVHVSHTFAATSTGHSFGFTTVAGQDTGSAGEYLYIANLRIAPGFGTYNNLVYFDGSTTDLTTTNLAAAEVPASTGGTVVTSGIIGPDGASNWYRAAGAGTVRTNVPLASLAQQADYTASWLVYNPSQTQNATLALDWADTPGASVVVAPLETRRVFVRGSRAYDSTFRFADLAIPSTGSTTILFKEVSVVATAPTDYTWDGTTDASRSKATPVGNDFIFKPDAGVSTLLGPVLPGICDDVSIEWLVSSPTGADVTLWAAPATPGGDPLEQGEQFIITEVPTYVTWSGSASPGFPDDWRPTLITESPFGQGSNGRQITIHSLRVTHRPVLSVEECVSPYRRTLHNVVTVSGPKVVEWLTLGDETTDSTVARVEWTWVATDPHQWHDPTPILTYVADGIPDYQAPGVNLSGLSTVSVNSTVCARPAVTATTCADNANGPGIVLPPQAPTIPDSGVMDLAGSNRTRQAFEIPEGLSPIGLGKLSWQFINDSKPKFGIRVRIWNDTQAGFLPETECNFIEEFTIEYLGPLHTLFIDGPGDDIYVMCGTDVLGQPVYADARKNVRGNYGGPFKNSLIGCGRPYYITVDLPDTYTNTPAISGQPTGTSQGDVVWSVELVRRG